MSSSVDTPSVVGVLALQGSFPLHLGALERCGCRGRAVRRVEHLDGLSGLIVPGGESTTIENLARKYGLFDAIRDRGRGGLPIFGTCAGAILLGRGADRPDRWELADVEVLRNAYGRQKDSFSADVALTPFDTPFHAVFIRAPKLLIETETSRCEVLGKHAGFPVLVRDGRLLLATFHPELTDDLRVHRYFLDLCGVKASVAEERGADTSAAGRAAELIGNPLAD